LADGANHLFLILLLLLFVLILSGGFRLTSSCFPVVVVTQGRFLSLIFPVFMGVGDVVKNGLKRRKNILK
jgi:hypothetical protein